MLILTRAERRKVVADAIRANPAHSDRRIALETGMARDTVRIVRAELIRDGVIGVRESICGSDGKTYPIGDRPDRPAREGRALVIAEAFVMQPLTASVLRIARAIDGDTWHRADELTRRTFRLACERLLATVRRLESMEQRGTG